MTSTIKFALYNFKCEISLEELFKRIKYVLRCLTYFCSDSSIMDTYLEIYYPEEHEIREIVKNINLFKFSDVSVYDQYYILSNVERIYKYSSGINFYYNFIFNFKKFEHLNGKLIAPDMDDCFKQVPITINPANIYSRHFWIEKYFPHVITALQLQLRCYVIPIEFLLKNVKPNKNNVIIEFFNENFLFELKSAVSDYYSYYDDIPELDSRNIKYRINMFYNENNIYKLVTRFYDNVPLQPKKKPFFCCF